jgi:hypothetical protein
MLKRLAALAACLVAFMACSAQAAERIIETEYTYVLGENDTRADARRTCFVEARRKAVEQAGTYVESETRVVDLSLTTDEVRAFAAAFVKAELVDEEFLATGGTFAVHCRVRAKVDTDTIGSRLADYAADPARRGKPAGAAGAEPAEAAPAPGDAAAPQPPAVDQGPEKLAEARDRLRARTRRLNEAVRQVVARGMAEADVQALLGEPGVKKLNTSGPSAYMCAKYGDMWVVYRDGAVACTRTRLEYDATYRGDCHCRGMAGATVFFP